MNGQEYEQFVRAVIARRCRIDPARITSVRLPGAILPGNPQVRHQVDLFFTERIGDADYLTIIECKYHESSKVEQEDVAKLAHTKLSLRAAKAILVTNTGFTSGADALAASERIALLVAPVNER